MEQKAVGLVRCGAIFNIARYVQLSDLIKSVVQKTVVVQKTKLLCPWLRLELVSVLRWVLADASTGLEADDETRHLLEEHAASLSLRTGAGANVELLGVRPMNWNQNE